YAQPPGKKLQSLSLLSGGEQALTATALIFGLFLTNPAPICVLDEVDAPLDDANIDRFCDLLDSMVAETRTRYLIVTHNAVTMSRMHRLFGVTMVEKGVSRLVSVDLSQAEALAAEYGPLRPALFWYLGLRRPADRPGYRAGIWPGSGSRSRCTDPAGCASG